MGVIVSWSLIGMAVCAAGLVAWAIGGRRDRE